MDAEINSLNTQLHPLLELLRRVFRATTKSQDVVTSPSILLNCGSSYWPLICAESEGYMLTCEVPPLVFQCTMNWLTLSDSCYLTSQQLERMTW